MTVRDTPPRWDHPEWPPVSVVMPVRDEEHFLAAAVERILDQHYAGPVELVIAVGPSRDRTHEIAVELAGRDGRVRVVDNPTGRTPQGLNAAVAAARHEIIIRVDGHGMLPPGYIVRAVETLRRTGADNVGGMMVPEGESPLERAVAAAMGSRVGIGGARFHVGGHEGPAETVYLGVFRRSTLERLGGFDEYFTRAQDWELNYRIRSAGGLVWFTPELRVSYRPRSSVPALARQFFRTGQWRQQVFRRYPDSANLRYLAAPVTVALLAAGTMAGAMGALGGPTWLLAGWTAPGGYVLFVLVGSVSLARGVPPASWPWLPVVLATMHLSWGFGFLLGALTRNQRRSS